MPLDENLRWRKPAEKALLPWPGFFYFHQHLSDRLLGFHAGSLCSLQIARYTPGRGIMAQPSGDTVAKPSVAIQL